MNVRMPRGPRFRLAFVVVGAAIMLGSTAAVTDAGGRHSSTPWVRMWHGIRIQSLDGPVAGATAAAGSPACPAPAPPKTTTTTTTSTATTTSSTTSSTTTSSSTAATSAQAASAAGTGSSAPPARPDQVLSNERTFSQWAYVAQTQPIYSQPSVKSKRVARLHWQTEDGFPEVYVLLRSHCDSSRTQWVQLRIPMRPNGHTGWVQRQALGRFHLTRLLIVVNRERMRMYLYNSGRLRWSAPVGVGKRSTPTPTGHFWIRERFKILDPTSGYWPYAFGTADYSTLSDWPGGGVVGVHGPYYAPQLIPGHPSHGCIRLHVGDDAWLARHVGVGTPLRVV